MKGFVFTDKIFCVAVYCSVCKIGKDLIKIRWYTCIKILVFWRKIFFTELQNSSFGELFNFAADFKDLCFFFFLNQASSFAYTNIIIANIQESVKVPPPITPPPSSRVKSLETSIMLNAFAIFCLCSKRQCLINIYPIFLLEFIQCYYLQQNYRCFKKETNSVYTLTVGSKKNKASCCGFSNFSVSPWFDHSISSSFCPFWWQKFLPFLNDTKLLEINC